MFKPRPTTAAADAFARSYMLGLTDCLAVFGTILADATGRTREEIAEVLALVIEKQRARGAGFDPVRASASDVLRQFFAEPVKRDWQA